MHNHERTCGNFLLVIGWVAATLLLLTGTSPAQGPEASPKIEVYTGYQWLDPGVKFPVLNPDGTFSHIAVPSMENGATGSLTWKFSQYVGLTGEYAQSFSASHLYTQAERTVSVGPHFEFRGDGFSLFLHVMGTWNRNTQPYNKQINAAGGISGGGFDLLLSRRITLRVLEADYVYGRDNFFDRDIGFPQHLELNGFRIGGGLVFNFLYPPETPPSASCTIQPAEVMTGEPVTATATTANFNPKHQLNYAWTSNGGKVTPKNTTATVDTTGVVGGSYNVQATITDPRNKKNGTATCSANFIVKEPPKNPPTMSCSANPSSVEPGGSVTITCSCSSPDNVPASVGHWTSTGGTVSGTGAAATLNTTGASPGTIRVSATCTDNRGLSSTGQSEVAITAPPAPPTPPPAPVASKLAECGFENMTKIHKPWRVDNECKGRLDDVAKNLQQNPDSRLVIVGNREPRESRLLAAQRAVNAKAYLTGGEAKLGIDAGRIECRTANEGAQSIELWIIPAGATFTESGTEPVDERKVKPVPDHPHAATPHKRKKAST